MAVEVTYEADLSYLHGTIICVQCAHCSEHDFNHIWEKGKQLSHWPMEFVPRSTPTTIRWYFGRFEDTKRKFWKELTFRIWFEIHLNYFGRIKISVYYLLTNFLINYNLPYCAVIRKDTKISTKISKGLLFILIGENIQEDIVASAVRPDELSEIPPKT